MKSSREISATSAPVVAWLHHARFNFRLRRFLFAIFLCLLLLPQLDAAVDFPVTDAQGKPITATHWGEVTYWINRANANPTGNKISLKVLNARAVVEVAGKGMLVERDTVKFEAEITPIDGWTIVSVKFISFNEEGTIQADKKKATFTMNFRKEPQPSTLLIGAKFRKNTDDPGDKNHKEEYIAAHVSVADLDTDSDNRTSSNRTHAEDLAENPAVGGTDLGKAVFYTPNADVDMDAVPDFADFNGIQPTGGSSAPWFPGMSLFLDGMPSGSKVRFVYSASDPAAVQQTTTNNVTTYEAAPGHLRVWTKNAYEIRNKEDILASGHYITPNTVYTLDQLNQHARNGRASPGLNHFTFFIEAIRPSTQTADQTVEVQLQFPGASDWVSLDKVSITLLPGHLLVDMDRNGLLETTDLNLNRPQKPYRFWSNDDIDRDDKDLTTGHDPDWQDGLIQCVRDLEDFARIQISLGGLRGAFVAGNLRLGLEWKQTTGNPSIQLYPQMDQTGSNDYLKNEQKAAAQIKPGIPTGRWALPTQSGATLIGVGQPVILPLLGDDEYFPSFLSTGLMPLIFEGCTDGKGQLCLTIHDTNGVKIGDGPSVWIEIKNIKAMYERARATTNYEMSPSGIDYTMPLPHDTLSTQPPEPVMGWEPDNRSVPFVPDPSEDTANKKYVIFVHGWRMSPQEINPGTVGYNSSTTFAETMFKRLWHTGYRGRFSAFRWPTFYGGPSPDDDFIAGYSTYNNSEYRAWKSGESLKQYVNQLPSDYRRNISAHSMGNIVVGSAFQKGLHVDRYMMLNAAVPAIAYDDQAPRNSPVLNGMTSVVSGFDDPTQVPTPNDDSDSSIKSKAYVNQLHTIGGGSTRIVNFYLAADDATLSKWNANNVVLRPHVMAWPKSPGYSYNPSATYSKMNLDKHGFVNEIRAVIDPHEVMSYDCKTPTQTVNAEGAAINGPIDEKIDMASYGFGEEHSAEWAWTMQRTHMFYQTFFDKVR